MLVDIIRLHEFIWKNSTSGFVALELQYYFCIVAVPIKAAKIHIKTAFIYAWDQNSSTILDQICLFSWYHAPAIPEVCSAEPWGSTKKFRVVRDSLAAELLFGGQILYNS